ncbi:MAG: DUF2141 domain-containing protein [Chlorobiaceae bacterium]|nr:DUF2141 domain-containing protein [Chlorobiaceae bacterium]
MKQRLISRFTLQTAVAAMILLITGTACNAAPSETLPVPSVTSVKTGRIVVTITDITHTGGFLGISLHNSKKGFPGKHELAVTSQQKDYSGSTEKFVFENVPYGTYAISVAHDENGNGKLDTNFIGIPKEGVGVSNNPKIGMGGPKYDPCSFMLNSEQIDLTITMKYL